LKNKNQLPNCFLIKMFFFQPCKNELGYYNASVAVINGTIVGSFSWDVRQTFKSIFADAILPQPLYVMLFRIGSLGFSFVTQDTTPHRQGSAPFLRHQSGHFTLATLFMATLPEQLN
jgi:hypothetical protein